MFFFTNSFPVSALAVVVDITDGLSARCSTVSRINRFLVGLCRSSPASSIDFVSNTVGIGRYRAVWGFDVGFCLRQVPQL